MAGNDTAALVVALSAQITKFEKDMQGAVAIADKHTKAIETRFGAMNSAIQGKLSQLGQAATSQLGFAGQLLSALGPAGIAAAVAIGTAIAAVKSVSDSSERFAEKAKALEELSQTLKLTAGDLKILGGAGKAAGLDFDETTAFFTQFLTRAEQLRQGSGPLFDAFLKIDKGLLQQMGTERDSIKQIDLLIQAYSRLKSASEQLDLTKAAGGKGGASAGRVLEFLGGQGGASGFIANSDPVDDAKIKRASDNLKEIQRLEKETDSMIGGFFVDYIQGLNKRNAELDNAIVKWLTGVKSVRDEMAKPLPQGDFNRRFLGEPSASVTVTGGNAGAPPKPASNPDVDLAILNRNIALLGDAISIGEQWKQKRLQIASAVKAGGIEDGVAARSLEAFRVVMLSAATAARERLGVATQEQITQSRLAQLSQDRTKFALSENEVDRARVVILRESKEAADALTVRQAYLPGLKQLELDAQSARKGLDTFATNSLNNLENALVDVVSGTKTAKEAFKAMANAIIADLARIAIRRAITGPLASSLGSLFGDVPVGTNASGTDNWRGGPTWVGENGPEIVNLPRGSQVVPNNIATRGGSSSGPPIVYAPNIDARGADAAAVARLAAAMADDRRNFQQNVMATVRGSLRLDAGALSR